MEQIMIDKLYKVYNDFKSDIYNRNNLCELKKFNFSSYNIPNYKDELIQKFYLLKYMLGYFCEYYSIYDQVINYNFLSNLNIFSIGCGCGLDLWGAKYANERHNKNLNIKYIGIDKVDWLYKDKVNEKDVKFILEDISKSSNFYGNDYNIIIFPKSISEFNKNEMKKILMIINNIKFNSARLVLISSMRKSSEYYDKAKMKSIVELLYKKHNYNVLDNVNCTWSCGVGVYGSKINELIPNLNYPVEIFDDIHNMYKNCKLYGNKFKCENMNCTEILGRRPITTTSQSKYQIIRLKRNQVKI